MLMDIIATIAAGAGLAGVILAIRKFSKGRLPKYIIPAAIGLGMLLFSVWNEYSWYPRVVGALPAEAVILAAPEDRVFYRPWTYLFPVRSRFIALDRTSMKLSEVNPAIRMADAMVVQRWVKTIRIPIGFDCANSQRVDLVDGAAIAPDGRLTGGTWMPIAAKDVMQEAACREG